MEICLKLAAMHVRLRSILWGGDREALSVRIDFEELAAGQGMQSEPILHMWALSCACFLLSACWCVGEVDAPALNAFLEAALHRPNESCARGLLPVDCWSTCGMTMVAAACAFIPFPF